MNKSHQAKLVSCQQCMDVSRIVWVATDSAGCTFIGHTEKEAIAMLMAYNQKDRKA